MSPDNSSICKGEEQMTDITDHDDHDTLTDIISRDDRDGFLSFIPKLLAEKKDGECDESGLCLHKVMNLICHHKAIACAAALIEGCMGLKVDLNVPIRPGVLPLHEAACCLSAGLVDLFLRNGAHTNIKLTNADMVFNGLLPLQIALGSISSNQDLINWIPGQSIYKLIILLCLPKMKEALETCRFLSYGTNEIMEVVRYCYTEGNLAELAILLIVAPEKVLAPFIFEGEHDIRQGERRLTFRKCLEDELALIINYEYKVMGVKEQGKLARTYNKKKKTLLSTIHLLEIFERAGDAIWSYIQSKRTKMPKECIAQEVGNILAQLHFPLKPKDTDLSDVLDSYSVELGLEQLYVPNHEQNESSGNAYISLSLLILHKEKCLTAYLVHDAVEPIQPVDICMHLNLKPLPCLDTKKKTCSTLSDQATFLESRFPRGKSRMYRYLRPFHAFWKPMSRNYSTGLPDCIEKMRWGTNKIERSVQYVPSCQKWISHVCTQEGDKKHMLFVSADFEVTRYQMFNSPVISQSVRIYHTSQSLRLSNKFCTNVQSEVKHAAKSISPCVPAMLNKLWPPFAASIRRGIKYI